MPKLILGPIYRYDPLTLVMSLCTSKLRMVKKEFFKSCLVLSLFSICLGLQVWWVSKTEQKRDCWNRFIEGKTLSSRLTRSLRSFRVKGYGRSSIEQWELEKPACDQKKRNWKMLTGFPLRSKILARVTLYVFVWYDVLCEKIESLVHV